MAKAATLCVQKEFHCILLLCAAVAFNQMHCSLHEKLHSVNEYYYELKYFSIQA
jgi:hypothetical protein